MSTHRPFLQRLLRAFPLPEYLTMHTLAISLSESQVESLGGTLGTSGYLPQEHKSAPLQVGTISNGELMDDAALVDALSELTQPHKAIYAHMAIPDGMVFVYTLYIQGRPTRRAIAQQIEFSFAEHVPISIDDAYYDFGIVEQERDITLVSVTAVRSSVVDGYKQAAKRAGITILSLESEANSQARALVGQDGIMHMIVNITNNNTLITIAKNQLPLFAISIDGGEEAQAAVLSECKEQYQFWDTRTAINGKRIERIGSVLVCGTGATDDFIRLLAKTLGKESKIEQADIWANLFDLDEYIPTIYAQDAGAHATLAGLLIKNKE